MKKSILFFLFTAITLITYSQDLIVTNNGDSVNCIITRVTKDKIYFNIKKK